MEIVPAVALQVVPPRDARWMMPPARRPCCCGLPVLQLEPDGVLEPLKVWLLPNWWPISAVDVEGVADGRR